MNKQIDKKLLDERKRIGKMIAEFRAKKGLSQMDIESITEKNYSKKVRGSHLARIELGYTGVEIETLKKIADALNCDIALIERN